MGRLKVRTFEILQVGEKVDFISKLFDFILISLISVNIIILYMETYEISYTCLIIFKIIKQISAIVFTVEYILRIWTSDLLYDRDSKSESIIAFILSTFGIIDLLAILPFYFPTIVPAGILALRLLRVVRIMKLFKVNRYYDSLAVIGNVIKNKKNQLLSSLFIIIVMLISSALVLYNVEHKVQPYIFDNAFTSVWFVVSNISTIGYGDIYPITVLGRILSIIITILGIGLVAIPTGIISAGFIEQVSETKIIEEIEKEKINDAKKHYCPYCGKKLD